MDWLSRENKFRNNLDKNDFGFHPEQPCEIHTIKIQRTQEGKVVFDSKVAKSADAYLTWAKQNRTSLPEEHKPTLLLAVHRRLDERATSLPYTQETFDDACAQLCQHRSLANTIARDCTAVVNVRPVKWELTKDSGLLRSIVYNCKSDTESLRQGEDIVLSATCFIDKPVVLAVVYGCTDDTLLDIEDWLYQVKDSVFHPLVLPMLFVELERRRLLDTMDDKSTKLDRRILEMKTKLKNEAGGWLSKKQESAQERTLTERDSEAIDLWRSISQLTNGLQTLLSLIKSLRDHLGGLSQTRPGVDLGHISVYPDEKDNDVYIGSRLQQMMAEIHSKLRGCEGLLQSMQLAMQMERDYYARQDARASYSLARVSSVDGSAMKLISRLGMFFLPATFLAGLFSMDFFNWMPPDSQNTVSPWLALYLGLASVFTILTWLYQKQIDKAAKKENDQTIKYVQSDKSFMEVV